MVSVLFLCQTARTTNFNQLKINTLYSKAVSITNNLLTTDFLFRTFASTYLSIKSVNPMQWGRQLVSRGANGRQLTTPLF